MLELNKHFKIQRKRNSIQFLYKIHQISNKIISYNRHLTFFIEISFLLLADFIIIWRIIIIIINVQPETPKEKYLLIYFSKIKQHSKKNTVKTEKINLKKIFFNVLVKLLTKLLIVSH